MVCSPAHTNSADSGDSLKTRHAGNNFGVDVQATIGKEIRDMAQVAMRIDALQRSHYDDRMRMAMTWCRYPDLEDHSVSPPRISQGYAPAHPDSTFRRLPSLFQIGPTFSSLATA
jgi:hypothetical protein